MLLLILYMVTGFYLSSDSILTLKVIMSLSVQMLCSARIFSIVAEIGTISKVAVVLVSRLKVGFCELKSHIDC